MAELRLRLRSRTEGAGVGSGDTEEKARVLTVPAAQTAIVIVDMWDNHWCRGALHRLNAMAPVMNRAVSLGRASGMHVIHAPAETMAYYAGTPNRRMMLEEPYAVPPKAALDIQAPPIPLDTSDGGCDTGDPTFLGWSRQHPAIDIHERDGITDMADEIYSYVHNRGIRLLLYMGVHPNMCVLNRSYGIKRFIRWGVDCAIVRDLTDVLYNPQMPPFISHEEANAAIIRYIETYWCPSVLSDDLKSALPTEQEGDIR